jgi:hypothetical protein
MRDVGTTGENFFSAWCSSVGITANKSVSDDHGWDLFIEMDSGHDISDPRFMHEPLIECKIQIKSTDLDKKSVPVTLSNLRKLATTPLPSFYVFLQFNGGDTPTHAYIQHVDDSLTSKILTRIRQLTSQNKAEKLNKKSMSLSFSAQMEIVPLTAKNIKAIISRSIGDSYLTYIEHKKNYLKTVGFEAGGHSLKFVIEGEENLEKLISMTLGNGGSVPIKQMCSMITRFGYSENLPEFSSDSAVIQVLKVQPESNGTVEFRFPESGKAISFKVGAYKAAMMNWIPESLRKLRLDSELIEINIKGTDSSIGVTLKLDNKNALDLNEAIKIYKLASELMKPQKIKLNIAIGEDSINLGLTHTQNANDTTQSLVVLEAVNKIKNTFEYLDPIQIRLPDIFNSQASIFYMECILDNNYPELALTFELKDGPGTRDDANYLIVHELIIGDLTFLIVYSLIGSVEQKNETSYEFLPSGLTILYKTTLLTAEIRTSTLLDDLVEISNSFTPDGVRFNLIEAYVKAKRSPS